MARVRRDLGRGARRAGLPTPSCMEPWSGRGPPGRGIVTLRSVGGQLSGDACDAAEQSSAAWHTEQSPRVAVRAARACLCGLVTAAVVIVAATAILASVRWRDAGGGRDRVHGVCRHLALARARALALLLGRRVSARALWGVARRAMSCLRPRPLLTRPRARHGSTCTALRRSRYGRDGVALWHTLSLPAAAGSDRAAWQSGG